MTELRRSKYRESPEVPTLGDMWADPITAPLLDAHYWRLKNRRPWMSREFADQLTLSEGALLSSRGEDAAKARRAFRMARKKFPVPAEDSRCMPESMERRVRLVAHLADIEVDGKVAQVSDAMDCDCTHGRYVNHIPTPSPMAAMRWINAEYDEAEGPVRSHYASILEEQETGGKTRDLALEAWEDGHPHVVYY